MHIDVIETRAAFDRVRENWERVYAADTEAQFFLSWTWLSQLFIRRPKNWCVLAARTSPSSDYVAFFPLRLATRYSKSRRQFINAIYMGGNFWADYTGFICLPGEDSQAIPAFGVFLKRMYWTRLHLENIHASQGRLALLLEEFADGDFSVSYRNRTSKTDGVNNLICPYIDLPADFDGYLQSCVSANTRQKIRRFLRKVENTDDFRIVESTAETRARDLALFAEFWTNRWAHRKGEEVETLAKKYQDILRQGLEENVLYMPILWQGDRFLGLVASFTDWQKQSLLFFVGARNDSAAGLPPGLILHAHSVRWAIEKGFKTYELLRGDEQYKYSLGAKDKEIACIRIRTRSRRNLNGRLDPRCLDEVLLKIARYEKRGKTARVRRLYRQILDNWPENSMALRALRLPE